MDTQILDDDQLKSGEPSWRSAMQWWERRRVYFALAVACAQVFSLVSFWPEVKTFGTELAIIQSFLFLIAANCFYCVGWGIELLVRYYFKGKSLGSTNWLLMFLLGTVFSVIYTVLVYILTLEGI